MSTTSVLSVELQPSKRLFWILVALHIGASVPIAMTLGWVGWFLLCPVLVMSFRWQWKRVNAIDHLVLDRDLGARITLTKGPRIRAELMKNWTHSSRLILLKFKVEPQSLSNPRGSELRKTYQVLILPDSLNPGDFHAILSRINSFH